MHSIYLVSPSGPVSGEDLQPAIEYLRDRSFRLLLDPDLTGCIQPDGSSFRFVNGSASRRCEALERAFASDAEVIWLSRGGVGFTEILPDLGPILKKAATKQVVGFSDATAFLLAAYGCGAMAMIHGPVLRSFSKSWSDVGYTVDLLLSKESRPEVALEIVSLPEKGFANASDEAPICLFGPVLGGNATLLATVLDHDYAPCFDGAILVVEDVGEVDFRLFRLLHQLATSRALRHVKAVVLGDFSQCHGVHVSKDEFPGFLRALGRQIGERLGCPVFAGFPMGHDTRNLPFREGEMVSIEVSKCSVLWRWSDGR